MKSTAEETIGEQASKCIFCVLPLLEKKKNVMVSGQIRLRKMYGLTVFSTEKDPFDHCNSPYFRDEIKVLV